MAEPALIDVADVQGLVRFGHGKLTEAGFLMLQVADAGAARRWLRAAPVTSAVATDPPPATALQVAFTADGLRALGVEPAVVEGFAQEFTAGMAGDAGRSRRLGDVGENAPSGWSWGADWVPHLRRDALRAGGRARRVGGRRRVRAGLGRRLRRAAAPGHPRHRPGGALRLRRRRQPAAPRLGARAAPRRRRGRRLHQPDRPRRGAARLPERVRALHGAPPHRPAARPARARPPPGGGPALPARPGAQRLLPGLPPAPPGRAGLLALPRRPGGRAARGALAPGPGDGGPHPRGRPPGAARRGPDRGGRAGRRRPGAERVHLRGRRRRARLPLRGPRAARQPAHRRPAARHDRPCRAPGAQARLRAVVVPRRPGRVGAVPPPPAAGPRVRRAAREPRGARGRRGPDRARPALHLPGRQPLAPVRVRAERVDREHEVRGPLRRARPAAREPRAPGGRPRDRRLLAPPPRRAGPAAHRHAAVRDGAGRRLLLPAGDPRPALHRRRAVDGAPPAAPSRAARGGPAHRRPARRPPGARGRPPRRAPAGALRPPGREPGAARAAGRGRAAAHRPGAAGRGPRPGRGADRARRGGEPRRDHRELRRLHAQGVPPRRVRARRQHQDPRHRPRAR